MEDAASADIDTIVDLMESELSSSSRKQDVSARAKFNAFLRKHVGKTLTFADLEAKDVSKEMVGKLLSYLFQDPDIHWQTSMSYLSSIKRQLEETTGTDLFRSEAEWYRRCRRHLQKQYLMVAITTGKKLKEQAPPMTMDDLRFISTILFLRNDIKALLDRTLLNKQWLSIGRSSDIGMIHFSDLHWQGNYFLIDMTRIKVRQQQSISIFCSPIGWRVDPFHALASQLVVDPYNASPRVFSQVTETSTEAHVAAYINRLLKSLYEYDKNANLTKNLQSHSARRGGAAYAGFPPTLDCFDKEPHQTFVRVSEFAQRLRLLHFAKIGPKGFADCLTSTLLMYYRDTLEIEPQHIVHQELQRVHGALPPLFQCQEELLAWGSIIRKRFVTDNILSLPLQHVKNILSDEEQSEQFVGIHTFSATLERILTGHQQLMAANEEMKKMLYRIIDRVERPREASPALCSACSSIISENSAITSVHTEAVPPLSLRSPSTSKVWPKSLNSLKGKRLSDFFVQFVMEDLGTVQKTPGNRAQKDCTRAVEIMSYVADLSSIPPIPQSSQGSDRLTWVCALKGMANKCEEVLVNRLSKATTGSQRKRRRTGKLTGIVKAWGELTDQQRAAFRLPQRIRFSNGCEHDGH